jgi:hypothetical protein
MRELGYHSPMPETFLDPQPFNVEIGPEADVTPAGRMPVVAPSLPVVVQTITLDIDLYPRQKHGMLDKVRTPARWKR